MWRVRGLDRQKMVGQKNGRSEKWEGRKMGGQKNGRAEK
jgi:hypothetical protein